MIVPLLAIAGLDGRASSAWRPAWAPSRPRAGSGSACCRHDPDRRRADLLPGARARPDRRAASPERPEGLLSHEHLQSVDLSRGTRRFQRFGPAGAAKPPAVSHPRPRGVLDPDAAPGGHPRVVPKAGPARCSKNPVMFVVEIGGRRSPPSVADAADRRRRHRQHRLHAPDHALAVVHRPVRQLRRGDGRSARQGPGRHPAPDPPDDRRPAAPRDGRSKTVCSADLRKGDIVVVERRGLIPGDGEVIEGVGVRQRGGHHRRVRARAQGARHRHPQLV